MSNYGNITQCLVMLTHDCNLRCNFCFEKNDGYSADEKISLENLKRIVDFCAEGKIKYLILSGGEPLMYPHLLEILEYVKSKCIEIVPTLATNGVLLSDFSYCEKLVNNGIKYLDLSMKGKNGEEWKKITGYDGFAKQQKAIANLSRLSVDFTCSMVVTSENVLSYCDAVQDAFNNGARQFSFTFVIDNDDVVNKGQPYLERNDPIKLINLFLSQTHRLSLITDDWWIEYSLPLCVYTEDQLVHLKGRLAEPCYVHMQNAITFDSSSNLLPCDMFSQDKMGQFGKDFFSFDEFKKLSNENNYQKIVKSLKQLPSTECEECPQLLSCYGGCPVLWKNYSFDALKKFKNINIEE